MTSPDLPPLPEPRLRFDVGITVIEGRARVVYEKGDPLFTADQVSAVQLAAYRAGMEAAARIVDKGWRGPGTAENIAAAIRRAAEGKTNG